MIQIPITNIANQTLSIQLDGSQYNISIHATKDNADGTTGIMSVDITRNNILLISGIRAESSFPLLPYDYIVSTFGNFCFVTQNNEYPDWRQFGITQYLIYASNEELNEIANGTFPA